MASRRILFVGFPHSVHTGRWIQQLQGQGWDLHLFAINHQLAHELLRDITVYSMTSNRGPLTHSSVRVRCLLPFARNNPIGRGLRLASYLKDPADINWAPWLARVIRWVKPDVIHSMEFQHAGYATLQAREILGPKFPTWIATNWGSDIDLFGRLPEHDAKIRRILALADVYSCECLRDVAHAERLGFKGKIWPVMPNTGGFDLTAAKARWNPEKTSGRRRIVLKGYQGWAGRALVALAAVRRCAAQLRGYSIVILHAEPDVVLAARLMQAQTGLDIQTPAHLAHEEVLALMGTARATVGVSIGDGISTMVLEAMVSGAIPIQSCTSCAGEWFADQRTGLLVAEDDPEELARALRRVLTEDDWVDAAAQENFAVAQARLNRDDIRPKVIELYRQLLDRLR